MEQESVNPAIGSILNEQKLKNIVYPARLFKARLNEEFLRANRTRKPFLFIKIYAHQFDVLGWGRPSKIVENTWKISVLTMFSHLRFIDVLGYFTSSTTQGSSRRSATNRKPRFSRHTFTRATRKKTISK